MAQYMAKVFNYSAGDEFIAFAGTRDTAIGLVVKAYNNYYGTDDEYAKDMGYDDMAAYLEEHHGMSAIKVITGVPHINGNYRMNGGKRW